MANLASFALKRIHISRLMQIWRSAGWPIRDPVELDLLNAHLIATSTAVTGHETLRLTDAGLEKLTEARGRARRTSTAHDALAHHVGQHLMDSGRIVWRELSFRAQFNHAQELSSASDIGSCPKLPLVSASGESVARAEPRQRSWRIARPDVFSVRNTSTEDYLHPMVHEVKVNRADLLSDLRHTAKRQSYQWLCCECFYVFPHGLAQPQEIPDDIGLWVLHGGFDDGCFELVRPARHVPCKLPFPVWLSLAKATPMRSEIEPRQCLSSRGNARLPT